MKIPRSYVENYSRALNVVSERARAALVDALGRIDYSADVSDIRNAVIAVMQPACGASSTVAARLAADFYDGLRAASLRLSSKFYRSSASCTGVGRIVGNSCGTSGVPV